MNYLKRYPLAGAEAELSVELTSAEIVDELEDIRYTTYGFRVLDKERKILFAAADVSTKREFVERFVEFCSGSDVRLIHIPDLLEDYMA